MGSRSGELSLGLSFGAEGQPLGQAGWAELWTRHALQPLATRGLQIAILLSRKVTLGTRVVFLVFV